MRMAKRDLTAIWQEIRHSRPSVSNAYSKLRKFVKPVYLLARMSMVRWIYADVTFIDSRQTSAAKKSASMCKGIGHICNGCERD